MIIDVNSETSNVEDFSNNDGGCLIISDIDDLEKWGMEKEDVEIVKLD